MPAVTVTHTVRAVELMAAKDPGDVLIEALKSLASLGAQAARDAGAAADTVLLPTLSLDLTMHWE